MDDSYISCGEVVSGMRPFTGVLGSWEIYLFFREQGEITIILREPGSKLLILGSWGALSKCI